jgi:GTPase SAR1 family protein
MNLIQEQRLARFVDRESEMRSFCRMLDQADWPRPIMVVWGEGGMGKSALLLRMMHECSLRSLAKAELVWTDTRNHDYLAVLRKIRDDIGAIYFGAFTKLVNFYTDPQLPQKLDIVIDTKNPITVGPNVSVSGSGQIGTMAGVVIRDLMLTIPRSDLGVSDNERMGLLTDQFIRDLDAIAAAQQIVVFFDALEKATEVTQRWIWGELFGSLREGRLSNVKFVIGGRQQPTIDEDWNSLIEQKKLAPLEAAHIVEYLKKRNADPGDAARDQVVKWILAMSGGSPLKLASAVEAMLSM